ncbi:MAG: hypothetical protein ABIB98_00125 [bacterium]
MDKNYAIKLLKEQIDAIDSLKHMPPYNPEYKIWNNTTEKLIKEAFDDSYIHLFNHQSAISYGMNRLGQMDSFVKKLEEKRDLLEGFIKEHERFNDDNPLAVQFSNGFQKYDFHSEINLVSRDLLVNGHYSQNKTSFGLLGLDLLLSFNEKRQASKICH